MIKFSKKIVIIAGAIALASCNKDDKSFTETLSELKKVVFEEKADEVINSEFQRVVTHGTTNKKEMLQTVKVQKTLAPVEIIDGKDLDVIFPGSVLDGQSFLEGVYNPLVIKNPKTITLSASLQGQGLPVNVTTTPVISDVRQKINNLINDHRNKIDYNNVASYLTYISNEVTTIESFNKTFGIHAKASAWAGKVSGNFEFKESKLTINGKKYVLIKVRQQFYNITVDPKPAEEWGDIQNIGTHEPVYISSVDYGRVAHLLVKTEENVSDVSKEIQAGISANFSILDANVAARKKEQARKYYESKDIKIMVAGGPLSAKIVTNYDSFMEFLENPRPADLVHSSAPIGYKVRTLKDNREVEVRTMYTEQRFAYE